MKTQQRTKLGMGVASVCGVLLAVAAFSLVQLQTARHLATKHLSNDIEIQTGLSQLATAAREQFGHVQEVLTLQRQKDIDAKDQRKHAVEDIEVLAASVGRGSSQLAQIAHESATEDDTYAAVVEDLMHIGTANQQLIDKLHTLERLMGEGRGDEANRFAEDVRSQTRKLTSQSHHAQQQFHADSIAVLVDYQHRERAAVWWFVGNLAAALALWSVYLRYRLRQTRIELARSRAKKNPRAQHLQVARAGAGTTDDAADSNLDLPLAGCRVLVAEDGPHNRRYIDRVLSSSGAEVVFAEDGEDATNRIFAAKKAGEAYDIVLMDMQMPIMDGHEATKTLRRFHYQGPVIALSADSQVGDRESCLNAGCDEHIAKPINRDALFAAVSRFYPATGEMAAEELCEAGAE